MSKKDQTFFPIVDILQTQIDELVGRRLDDTLAVQKQWADIVGAAIAVHSKVLFIKNQCLHVGVKNSTWLSELNLMKDVLREKLAKIKTSSAITDLKFKIYFEPR